MYFPGQRRLTFDQDNVTIVSDVIVSVVEKLDNSIRSNNIEEFKKIYKTEYIDNPKICDYFNYEDENNNNLYNSYSLCTCANKEEEPTHIHRNLNSRPCNCINGKRYLAYLRVFNAEINCICYDTNPTNVCLTNLRHQPYSNFLLQDGPIDLTYNQFFYKKNTRKFIKID